jgi:hypothetical protein
MATTPNLLSVAKIWDQGAHNPFTDLLRFDDRWWCTFREAEEHGPSIGTVRVITSEDGADWQSVAVLEEQEVDLRDPKLSVTPDGRLMLVMGGCVYGSGEHGTRSPRIAFTSETRSSPADRDRGPPSRIGRNRLPRPPLQAAAANPYRPTGRQSTPRPERSFPRPTTRPISNWMGP